MSPASHPLLERPSLPASQIARNEFTLRYDDLDQEGRLQCAAAAHALGPAVWRTVLAAHPVSPWCRKNIVLPILSRLVVERGDGPLAVRNPVAVEGALELAHVPGPEPGSVDRMILSMWVTLEAPIGLTNGPPPPDKGRVVRAGRVYAEHVLTAAFAPPGERKVRRLGGDGVEPIPPRVYEAPPLDTIALVPADATPLGEPMRTTPHLFGLMHTDANRHVNSLVYATLFEEAALRLLAGLGERGPHLARTLELGYRRPFFAGDEAVLELRAFRDAEGLGVAGAFYPAAGAAPRASTYARIRF